MNGLLQYAMRLKKERGERSDGTKLDTETIILYTIILIKTRDEAIS
jgi:hypothetical protein